MDFVTTAILGIGLSMDAFAVSICKGLALGKVRLGPMAAIALWFGVFHIMMPIIGFYVGRMFYDYIEAFDHWVAFGLLILIGGNMLREAFSSGEEENVNGDYGFRTMFPLSLAVSIDALAVGISLAMNGDSVFVPAAVLGIMAMLFSVCGVALGGRIGDRLGNKADILGGSILILIGFKVLFEGLGYI